MRVFLLRVLPLLALLASTLASAPCHAQVRPPLDNRHGNRDRLRGVNIASTLFSD